jgi:hypothetical protein
MVDQQRLSEIDAAISEFEIQAITAPLHRGAHLTRWDFGVNRGTKLDGGKASGWYSHHSDV